MSAEAKPLVFIERGGHRLLLEEKEGYFRVCCNGAIHATFNIPAAGEVDALKSAVAFLEKIETNALKYPKP